MIKLLFSLALIAISGYLIFKFLWWLLLVIDENEKRKAKKFKKLN